MRWAKLSRDCEYAAHSQCPGALGVGAYGRWPCECLCHEDDS